MESFKREGTLGNDLVQTTTKSRASSEVTQVTYGFVL